MLVERLGIASPLLCNGEVIGDTSLVLCTGEYDKVSGGY